MNVLEHLFFSSRRRHTICGRDWSSDVCSSDLFAGTSGYAEALRQRLAHRTRIERAATLDEGGSAFRAAVYPMEIGRASWRGRAEIFGGARSLEQKQDV